MFAERVQEAECGYVMNKTAGEDIFKECLYSPASSSKIFEENRIPGVAKFSRLWLIPKDAKKPADKRKREENRK